MAVSSSGILKPGAITAYLGVAKAKGIVPHLITAAAGFVLAAQGNPDPLHLALTLAGGSCMVGAANAINSYLDRDIDALMSRTSHRPLPLGRVPPRRALVFGMILALCGMSILGILVNWIAAALAVAALLYYTAYTLLLKRRSYWAAVIGSGAGAMPPLIGWMSVTTRIETAPFILSAIIVLWTLPHFWSLAIIRRADFEKANLKVLPSQGANWWIGLTSLLLAVASLAIAPAARLGPLYLGAALPLNAGFLGLTLAMIIRHQPKYASRLYQYSIFYMATLFLVIIFDKVAF